MEVKRYVYQSPYNSPVQFGREDPSMKKNGDETKLMQQSNQTLQKAQTFSQTTQKEVTPRVNETQTSQRLLDTYA